MRIAVPKMRASEPRTNLAMRVIQPNDHNQRCEPAANVVGTMTVLNGWLASAEWCGSVSSFFSLGDQAFKTFRTDGLKVDKTEHPFCF
jgi:hypothetical protein